ncbi:PIR Superfamily Protein [Plasmodium ovale wallikeri]|uniref:PIR Superfamily Protein n=2 Tax=Plasmodium ovale TaxID=36330 RepID=A0A1A9AMW0_PLAOA|nr:PIR Superfamily Protein [Plasmodium ovale wallikeri]SBT57526.1 PIR Superfamily Protein [Plasmodium ovale wallikeri]SBT73703.1 Plasmodium vivax Vir protein, putative [Plasmodium ovale]
MALECSETSVLPSCKIYNEFNQENDHHNLSDQCRELMSMLGNNKGIENLCSELERNLNVICTKGNNDGLFKNRVEYLHFWLLNKAIKNFGIEDDGSYNGICSRFHHTWNSFIKTLKCREECKPLHSIFFLLEIQDVESTWDIYNYYYNYKYFDINKNSPKNDLKEYCKYLSSMRERFAKFQNLCSSSSNICSSFLENSIHIYEPEKLRTQLNCNIYELDTTIFEDSLTQEKPGGITSTAVEQSHIEPSSELGTLVNYPEAPTSAISVGLSFFSLLSIGFVLFKVSPIRSWFYNRIIKKMKNTVYLDDETSSELSDDYFLNENINSQGDGYSIAYNSI